MKNYLLIAVLFFLSNFAVGQELPKTEMHPYRDAQNKLFWNKHQEVFVGLSTKVGGKVENLGSDISADYADPMYFDTEGINYMRSNWAVNKTTGKTVLPKLEIKFEVYADGLSPKTESYFSSTPKMLVSGKTIYGKGLQISLSATDATSGVETLYFSLNGAPYAKYSDILTFDKEGEYSLKYLSVDNVGNIEKVNEKLFSIDLLPPSTKSIISGIKITDKNIISLRTKIYFNISDAVSGVAHTYYSFDGGENKLYKGQNIPLIALNDGEHSLKFYSIDKVNNTEDIQSFDFYLDRTAPITASDILGDRFIVGDQMYFSGRTKLKLTAVDNKSGIKDVQYSVDNSEFSDYQEPFYLPGEQGLHVVKYYATDKTENVTKGDEGYGYQKFTLNVDKIYVDLTGPSLNHSIIGSKFYARDTIFIGPNTTIKLLAKDNESGLQYISYSIDGEQKETEYKKPFTVKAQSGLHKIEFFGYDNVNNRNIGTFYIFTDNEGPVVNYKFSIVPSGTKDGVEIYPHYASLFLTVQDKLTGVSKIYYSLNGAKEISYKNYIKGFKKNAVNTLKVRAFDRLKNETIKEISFFVE